MQPRTHATQQFNREQTQQPLANQSNINLHSYENSIRDKRKTKHQPRSVRGSIVHKKLNHTH